MISKAFYWSLTLSQFTDNKRKDFWQIFIHHTVTLMLLYFGWASNFHRMGALIFLAHDSGDLVLEAIKAAKYAKLQRTCDILLGIFFITWIVSRLMVYPRILCEFVLWCQKNFFPMIITFNILFVIVQILNIYWTYLIAQIVLRSLKKGTTDGMFVQIPAVVKMSSRKKKIKLKNSARSIQIYQPISISHLLGRSYLMT
jgi:sphingoid base N-palmitoyltransferase